MSSNFQQLAQIVIHHSVADTWDEAVKEWEIVDCVVLPSPTETCVCGYHGIKFLFSIQNSINERYIFPVGRRCILHFGRDDLKDKIAIYDKLFALEEEYNRHRFIEFSSKLFSKKLLLYFLENGCFKATAFNQFNPKKDYEFLLQMFNRRKERTPNQEKKIRALMRAAIVPFVKSLLHHQSQTGIKTIPDTLEKIR